MTSNPLSGYYYVTPTELDGIATAIQLKTGISDSLTYPNNYIEAIGSAGGITSEALDYITGNMGSVLSDSTTTIIKSAAFFNCSNLVSVYLGNCDRITDSAFMNCSSLEYVSAPKLRYISYYAFYSCNKLSYVYAPSLNQVGESAFQYCTALSSISLPNCYSLGTSAFGYCYSLKSINLPNMTSKSIPYAAFSRCSSLSEVCFSNLYSTIGNYAFHSCSSLVNVSLPLCTQLGVTAFGYCYSLTNINLPSCLSISNNAFGYCTNLSFVKLPLCSSLGGYVFDGCHHLLSIYLTNSILCTLSSSTTFNMTPISSYTTSTGGVHGSIFVPRSLYDSYITATNWVTYSDRITSLMSDLTGTSWEINGYYTLPPASTYSITFSGWIGGSVSIDKMVIGDVASGNGLIPAAIVLYSGDAGWIMGSSHYTLNNTTIYVDDITGGTDASNADLIKWFYDNGTQI